MIHPWPHNVIHIIVTGVVDVQLMSVEDHRRVLAVAEIKSSGEGIYQLLAALYRIEMLQEFSLWVSWHLAAEKGNCSKLSHT